VRTHKLFGTTFNLDDVCAISDLVVFDESEYKVDVYLSGIKTSLREWLLDDNNNKDRELRDEYKSFYEAWEWGLK